MDHNGEKKNQGYLGWWLSLSEYSLTKILDLTSLNYVK